MTTFDLLFPVRGNDLPIDHAYPLYASLSAAWPGFHDAATGARFAAITGMRVAPGRIALMPWSRLRVRVPDTSLTGVLPLAGRSLRVGDANIMLGPPMVVPLVPAPTLRARVVTFKHADTPERFLATARARLTQLEIAGEPVIPLIESGPRLGEPRRRVVRVKGKTVIGYALEVSALTAAESQRLQEHGLGGRTRLGCGFFLPVRREA
jgi:CRISPR-associated protein Cas6